MMGQGIVHSSRFRFYFIAELDEGFLTLKINKMKLGEELTILRGGKKTTLIFIEDLESGLMKTSVKETGDILEIKTEQIITDNQIQLL